MPATATYPRPFLLNVRPGDNISTALQAAIDAGRPAHLPPGEFLASGVVLRTGSQIVGAGRGLTTLRLAAGAATDLLVTEGFSSLTGGTTTGGPLDFAIRSITLDGNRANVTSGYPLRVYGRTYTVDDVDIVNGKSGGVYSQWGPGGSNMEARFTNFTIYDSDGTGLDWRGPHDSMFVNGIVARSGAVPTYAGTAISVPSGSHGASCSFANVHTWGNYVTGWSLGQQAMMSNCQAEGAQATNVVLGSTGSCWLGGMIFGTNGVASATEVGMQIGEVGNFAGQLVVDTYMHNFGASGRPINWVNGGYCNIRVAMRLNASTVPITGGPDSFSSVVVNADSTTGSRYQSGSAAVFRTPLGALFTEMADPAAPSANQAYVFARDNGSGKTQWCVRFSTGAVQVIATEP